MTTGRGGMGAFHRAKEGEGEKGERGVERKRESQVKRNWRKTRKRLKEKGRGR